MSNTKYKLSQVLLCVTKCVMSLYLSVLEYISLWITLFARVKITSPFWLYYLFECWVCHNKDSERCEGARNMAVGPKDAICLLIHYLVNWLLLVFVLIPMIWWFIKMALRLATPAEFEADYCYWWLLVLAIMIGLLGVCVKDCWIDAEGVSVGGNNFVG